MAAPVHVELRDVRLEVEGRLFLDGASLAVRRGESVVVAGEPGCGKSFVLRVLLGMPGMDADAARLAGDVIVGGQALVERSEAQLQHLRRRTGSVLRGGALIDNMDIRRNIALPLHYHYRDVIGPALIDARCQVLLDHMGLTHLGEPGIRPVSLHAEERLCVALARALVCEPELLLLDDPTGSASPAAARRLAEFAFRYRPDFEAPLPDADPAPPTRLVTCSDLGRYLDDGDRFVLLSAGRLEELGDRDAVLASDVPQVRALLAPQRRVGEAVHA